MTSKDGNGTGAYEFGDFRVEAGRRLLLHKGEPVPLAPKTFDTLLALVRRPGELVGKDDLMRAVWPDAIVEENNLNQHIAALRRMLQDPRGTNRFILTVPGRGFRFVADVETVEPLPPPGTSRHTLAVLPFDNLSADSEREYLADGLTEETIAALGQVDPDHLSVISRTSVMAYKRDRRERRRDRPPPGGRASGRRLDSCRRRPHPGHRAAGTHSRSQADLVGFVRQRAAQHARVPARARGRHCPAGAGCSSSRGRVAAMGLRQTRSAEAFDAYLRGRHLWHRLTPPTTRRALDLYAQATRLDPDYALAWSGIADAHCAGPISGDVAPSDVRPSATSAALQAFRARPDLAEAQASMGQLKFWLDWDWRGAEASFQRAIELDPSYAFSYRMLGILYSHVGRVGESLTTMRRARELDPLLPVHHALSAQVAFAARDFELAMRFARQALAIDPEFWIGHWQVAQASVELGDHELALQALGEAGRTSGGNSKVVALRGYLFGRLGRVDEARQVLDTLVALSGERYVPPWSVALVHLGLGAIDESLAWLERALEARDVHLMFVPIDPKWDDVRTDSRIAAILRRGGFTIEG